MGYLTKAIPANLKNADLRGAYLLNADFSEVNLQGANLQGADLREAVSLTIGQLAKVKTLYQAKLAEGLLKEVQAKYPHLLEEPKRDPKSKEEPK